MKLKLSRALSSLLAFLALLCFVSSIALVSHAAPASEQIEHYGRCALSRMPNSAQTEPEIP